MKCKPIFNGCHVAAQCLIDHHALHSHSEVQLVDLPGNPFGG